MWRRIFAYILFGLGFLTVTFFRNFSGDIIPYPFLFWLLGLIMFWGGFLFLRYTPSTNELNIQKQVRDVISDLKVNGDKIKVDLTKCELKEHNYTEEREKYGHKNELLTLDIEREIQGWDALSGGAMRNVEQVQVTQTVIIYSYLNNRTGQTEKFISRVIPKDKITLTFYLDKQKETTLYVDKTNRERYYFDLDFLTA
ncbi:hypothetical protein GCM10027036_34410 [Flavihumibacter cheonanensis]|uniref:hypothetical protein n=1 Tax=Flavihumibacter cheonanensis TaxID=1442385 RepID=UPI001EF7A1DB|nr:hypothetical protein [Flavihumibacter cheonanensis]MCG7754822.1 hypothetical protein [Flavihumibacter cheonanensis]